MPIKVENLYYAYLANTPMEAHALHHISFEIKDGSFTAFIGHTGSGKSTLMQCLNGLLTPLDGTITLDNYVITNKKRKNKKNKNLRKHIGLVFQFPEAQLFEETIVKDVAFGPRNFGVKEEEANEIAKSALLSVGITPSYFERSPFELSGGERRRVAIAGIIAIHPDILVLDEPTAGLDPKGCEEIMSLVKKMHDDGTTIILVTHDMNLVQQYCTDVFVLDHGNIAFNGTPSELFENMTDDMSLEIPPLFKLAKQLKDKGLPVDFNNLKTIDDLVYQIKEWRK